MWTISKFCKIIFLIFLKTCVRYLWRSHWNWFSRLPPPDCTRSECQASDTMAGAVEVVKPVPCRPICQVFLYHFFFYIFYPSRSLHSCLLFQCYNRHQGRKPTASFFHLRHNILESACFLENAYYCYHFFDYIVYCNESVNTVFPSYNTGRHHCARCVFM